MTVSISILTVISSIAALTFPGVTVLDIDEVPENMNLRSAVLYPNPDGLIRGAFPRLVTFSTLDLGYDIRYRYWHCGPLGTGLFGGTLLSAATNIIEIMEVFAANDTVSGCRDLRLVSMSDWPIMVKDPAGNDGWGCDFTLHVQEFINP